MPDVRRKDEDGPVAVRDLELEEDEAVGGGVGVGGGALRPLHALVEEGVVGVGIADERALLDELGKHLHPNLESLTCVLLRFLKLFNHRVNSVEVPSADLQNMALQIRACWLPVF